MKRRREMRPAPALGIDGWVVDRIEGEVGSEAGPWNPTTQRRATRRVVPHVRAKRQAPLRGAHASDEAVRAVVAAARDAAPRRTSRSEGLPAISDAATLLARALQPRPSKAARDRARQELMDAERSRQVFRLADVGEPADRIAEATALTVDEVRLRIRRRAFMPPLSPVRLAVLRRAADTIATAQMLESLQTAMRRGGSVPTGAARWDGGASASGPGQELMWALQDGLLLPHEYEQLRRDALPADRG